MDAQAPTSVDNERTVASETTVLPGVLPFLNTDGTRSRCPCDGTANEMNVTAHTGNLRPDEDGGCRGICIESSDGRRAEADRNNHSTPPAEIGSTGCRSGGVSAGSENPPICNQYTLCDDLRESGPDSEDLLTISSDELTDSDRSTNSDDHGESDADVSNTRTSTDFSSSDDEGTSKSSSHDTAIRTCYSSDAIGISKGATSSQRIASRVPKSIPTTTERRESDVDCEIDGDRVKFTRDVSVSQQKWDDEMWNSPESSPKLTTKEIFAKIDKDFKAHAMELKSFPLFSRRHSDLRLPPLGKLNFPRFSEFRSFDYSPDLFSKKSLKLAANPPCFTETRSRSAESRVDEFRKTFDTPKEKFNSTPSLNHLPTYREIFDPRKEKFNSTPSLHQLPSYNNEKQALEIDKSDASPPKIPLPWCTGRSQFYLPSVDFEIAPPSDAGEVKPKRWRMLSNPTENRNSRSDFWHAAKKMKGMPGDVLDGDHSEVCLSSVTLEIVSSSSTVVRGGAMGRDGYRPRGRPEYRRHTILRRKRLSVPTKVAVVLPFRDAPCSDNNGDDSKTTTGLTVGSELRPASPGGELRPPSVCSSHAASKPVSPAKGKALSSKHSSKHSSPIKTLSSAAVTAVPDIEHSDSLDSDDQSSRVSTGLGSLEVVVCPVQKTHHVGREIINAVYGIPIDSLFTLLFTNSKMMLEVHALRKTTDLVASPWQSKDDGQQRLRQVTYTVALPTNSFGPKVSHVTEIQVMSELTVPGEYYSVDAEATNAGIPYAESFLVSNHWCLTRENATETRLAVYTSVKYKKSMWGFMKSVIDKNSYSGVEGLLQGIDSALQQEVTEHANMRQRTRRRRRRGTVKLEGDPTVVLTGGVLPVVAVGSVACAGATGVVKDKIKAKLPVNNILVNRLLGPSSIRSTTLPRTAPLGSGSAALSAAAWHGDSPDAEQPSWPWPRCRVLFTTLLLILLLFTNLLLFWRLSKLEEMVKIQPHYAALRGFMHLDPDIVRKEIPSDAMLQILQEQELSHVKMTEDWRSRISEAESLLHQAEGMLRGLHASIPADQSAASRTLLDRLRSSSSVLQASIEGHNSKASGDEPNLSYIFGSDIESDSSHSRQEL